MKLSYEDAVKKAESFLSPLLLNGRDGWTVNIETYGTAPGRPMVGVRVAEIDLRMPDNKGGESYTQVIADSPWALALIAQTERLILSYCEDWHAVEVENGNTDAASQPEQEERLKELITTMGADFGPDLEDQEIHHTDEKTGELIRYVPFIDGNRLGFHIRNESASREETVYLEACSAEPLVWLHAAALEDESEPITFIAADIVG